MSVWSETLFAKVERKEDYNNIISYHKSVCSMLIT